MHLYTEGAQVSIAQSLYVYWLNIQRRNNYEY